VLLAGVPVVTRLRAPVPLPATSTAGVLRLLSHRLVIAGIAFVAIDFLTFGAFSAVWARVLSDLGASTVFIGLSFAAISVPLVVLGPGLGRRVDRRSPSLVAIPGAVAVLTAMPPPPSRRDGPTRSSVGPPCSASSL